MADKKEAKGNWEDVEGGGKRAYWNPEDVGDKCIGIFVRSEMQEYEGKERLRHVIKAEEASGIDDTVEEVVLPDHKVLMDRFAMVKIGSRVLVEYIGKTDKAKAGRKKALLYRVAVDKDYVPQKSLTDTAQNPPSASLEDNILNMLYPPGVHESKLWDVLVFPDATAGQLISAFDTLKRTGKVTLLNGCWVRT